MIYHLRFFYFGGAAKIAIDLSVLTASFSQAQVVRISVLFRATQTSTFFAPQMKGFQKWDRKLTPLDKSSKLPRNPNSDPLRKQPPRPNQMRRRSETDLFESDENGLKWVQAIRCFKPLNKIWDVGQNQHRNPPHREASIRSNSAPKPPVHCNNGSKTDILKKYEKLWPSRNITLAKIPKYPRS